VKRTAQQTGSRRPYGLSRQAENIESIARKTGSRWADGLSRQAAGSEKGCATDRHQKVKWTEQAGSRQCEGLCRKARGSVKVGVRRQQAVRKIV
jgi:hypothetical protein